MPVPLTWFDAHLDLAYLAVNGRDMLAPLDPAAGPHPPASVTLPALAEGGVRFALATIFTEPDGNDASGYPAGNVDRAAAVGRAQLDVYRAWQERGAIGLGFTPSRLHASSPLRFGILVENADPIRSPDELAWWKDRGVVAIGLAWSKASRYAAGNGTPPAEDRGLTDLGLEMVRQMDRLGVVHDASHLSDTALADLFAATDRPVIASHSNCRELLDNPIVEARRVQRHLSDETIREIARRGGGGVIGLNLYSAFLTPDITFERPRRAPLADAVRHVEHICELVGHRRAVGLGSDMDGGFSAAVLPEGIDSPRDLHKLADALRNRGWTDDDVTGFTWKNWARFWQTVRA